MRNRHLVMWGLVVLLAAPLGADTRGWRTNWTGRYPEAKPVTSWSEQENVIWKTATSGWGNATPVVVGDKIFFSIEKMTLACASLADGKILWKKELAYEDMFTPDDKAKIKDGEKKAKEIGRELAPINKELRAVRKQLKQDRNNEELKAKTAELKKKVAELQAKLKPFQRYKMPKTNGTNGYSSPTPVSDGTHVYVLYGPGIAACYDLNGNRKWLVMVERPEHGWGHSASPVLVGDTLVVHVINVAGLDAATGKEKWRAPSKAHWGSPIPVRIGKTDAVVTTNGEIVRVSDGKVLTKGLFSLPYGVPVCHEGVVYAIDGGANAIALKLPKTAGNEAKPDVLWKAKVKKDRYYASLIVHDGTVYAITQKGVLTALAVKDGEKLYEQKINELGKGTVYPSLVLASSHLFVSIDNGTTLEVKLGDTFEILNTNKLDGFRATPVFEGNAMVVRTLKNLYKIGAR